MADMEMSGSMKFKGELLFEGKFSGGSIDGNTLVIGEQGEVNARISVDNLTISGRVKGEVTVTERCQLKSTSHVQGNLRTSRLVMDDGATLSGGIEISKPAAPKPEAVA